MTFPKTLLISSFVALGLSACTSSAINSAAPIILEQHKNIAAQPATKHNLARLIQQKDHCLIEFTGNFENGQATEYWLFKGDQLISAFTQIQANIENSQTVFDIHDPTKQANFKALQNNFKKSNLDQCQ